jgi:acetyl-CoA synthetase
VGWFWQRATEYLQLAWQVPYTELRDDRRGKEWTKWFSGGSLNATENCLDRWVGSSSLAVISESEDGKTAAYTYQQLAELVEDVVRRLRLLGVEYGDPVGLYMGMNVYAVASLLACIRIGAPVVPLFSGYGWEAVQNRLVDSEARYVITQDSLTRRGKSHGMKAILDQALEVEAGQVRRVAVWRLSGSRVELRGRRDEEWLPEVARSTRGQAVRTPTDHTLLLGYTSGSTGRPKGAIHTHGGLPIKVSAEYALCFDMGPGERILWVSDMGWILGPSLVIGSLTLGSTLVLYDGAIDFPNSTRLWELVEKHQVTLLGVAPTAVRVLMQHRDIDWERFNRTSLRYLAGTGEPWDSVSWGWFSEAFGRNRCPILNYSGGTEVGGGIISSNPLAAQEPCSFAGPSPGMDAEVFGDDGQPIRGHGGELVVRQSWPGMTAGFWKDDGRYLSTYWSKWPGVWVHGDRAAVAADGLWYVHGRSDDTINVAGRRMGPSEVEEIAMQCPGVAEVAVVGLPDSVKGASLACFVVGNSADPPEQLANDLRVLLAERMGKAMRPDLVGLVAELPKTRNAKILRRVVRAAHLREQMGDLTALENPSAIEAIQNAVLVDFTAHPGATS